MASKLGNDKYAEKLSTKQQNNEQSKGIKIIQKSYRLSFPKIFPSSRDCINNILNYCIIFTSPKISRWTTIW